MDAPARKAGGAGDRRVFRLRFLKEGDKKAFAADVMGEEALRFAEKFCAELAADPEKVIFVFDVIIGAGAVREQAAHAESRPGVGQDAPLPLGAEADVIEAPLPDGEGIFAKKALSGAWQVGEEEVEIRREAAKGGGVVLSDDCGGIAPFDEVFDEDGGAGADGFVGHKEASFGKEGEEVGGFSAGGGAEVEGAQGLPEVGSEHGFEVHRGGFLNVVTAGVEERIERKRGAIVEITGEGGPGDGVGEKGGLLVGVPADADGGRLAQCVLEGGPFGAEEGLDLTDEIGG